MTVRKQLFAWPGQTLLVICFQLPCVYISEFECSLMHSLIEIVLVDDFIHDLCTYKGCFSNCSDTCHFCIQDYFTIALLLIITVLKVLPLVLVILWKTFQLITW